MSADSERVDLSVVVPTLGRETLIATVESLLRARGGVRMEIIVAGRIREGNVRERLGKIVSGNRDVRHLDVEYSTGDSSRKKNAGMEAARADIVAFVDDDVEVAPDWAERILEPFADEGVGLVSGPALIPEGIGMVARLAGAALQSAAAGYVAGRYRRDAESPRPIRWSRIIGCNMAYRRRIWDEIGGFDPAFWPGEEMLAAYRAGRRSRIIFYPRAWVFHYPRTTLRGFIRQMYGYGATRIRLIRAGVDLEPSTLIPGVWVASLAVFGGMAFFGRPGRLLLGLDVGLYLVADLLAAFLKALETRRVSDLGIAGFIPLMHLSYGIAEWVELLRPGRDFSGKV